MYSKKEDKTKKKMSKFSAKLRNDYNHFFFFDKKNKEGDSRNFFLRVFFLSYIIVSLLYSFFS